MITRIDFVYFNC